MYQVALALQFLCFPFVILMIEIVCDVRVENQNGRHKSEVEIEIENQEDPDWFQLNTVNLWHSLVYFAGLVFCSHLGETRHGSFCTYIFCTVLTF